MAKKGQILTKDYRDKISNGVKLQHIRMGHTGNYCPSCGKKIVWGAKSCKKHRIFSYQHRLNISKSIKGKQKTNPNKRKRADYETMAYKEWHGNVLQRDEFRCQICKSVGKKLVVHHIKRYKDYPESRLDPKNGISLCLNCHLLVHGKKYNGPYLKKKHCRIKKGQ